MKTNLFLIGASKCGTTYLHDLLQQHPDICGGKVKEPFFFQRNDYDSNFSWYESLFSDCLAHRYVCDSSPTYSETLSFPDISKRIYNYSPDARIIYIVREPFSRLKSVWAQAISSGHWAEVKYYDGKMPVSYQKAVFNYPPFLDACHYWTHLNKYREYYPDSNIQVILFDDLISKTQEVLDAICTSLEIKKFSPDFKTANTNPSKGKKVYNPIFQWIREVIPKDISKNIPVPFKEIIEKLTYKMQFIKLDSTDLTLSQKEDIRKKLDPEIRELYKYLNIKDDPWNYFV